MTPNLSSRRPIWSGLSVCVRQGWFGDDRASRHDYDMQEEGQNLKRLLERGRVAPRRDEVAVQHYPRATSDLRNRFVVIPIAESAG